MILFFTFRKEMIDHYHELNHVNKTLINGYNIKAQNYNEGIETMKKINNIIQKASRLRGTIKLQNIQSLYHLFCFSWTKFGSYD